MTVAKHASNEGEVRLTDFEETRGLRYAELFAVGSEWIDVYNSTGLSEASPDLWEATDPRVAAAELGVDSVIKNGPQWWVFDGATLRFAVEAVTVAGVGYRWCARLPAFLAKSGNLEPPFYTVVVADKEGELRYSAGRLVYELASPEGEAFVMQGSSIEPSEWAKLGDQLTLAHGWKVRTRMLEEDLTVPLDGKSASSWTTSRTSTTDRRRPAGPRRSQLRAGLEEAQKGPRAYGRRI